ncbi:MAG: hypothetical protein IJ771_08440, partial [Clostridia bacterium]|nr:hypothetical protein [Clostridia bacterium]
MSMLHPERNSLHATPTNPSNPTKIKTALHSAVFLLPSPSPSALQAEIFQCKSKDRHHSIPVIIGGLFKKVFLRFCQQDRHYPISGKYGGIF